MSYSYDVLDDGHIILLTMHSDCDVVKELWQIARDGYPITEQNPAPIVFIADARALYFTSFNQVLEAANAARTLKAEDRLNQHPKVIKSLAVISSRVVQITAKSLNNLSFGYIDVTIVNTLEEALLQARALLKEAGYDGLSATA